MTVQLQPGLTQRVQIGQESTAGTLAGAGKQLIAAMITPTDEHETRTFRPQGRRFDRQVEAEKDWSSFDVSGDVLYSEIPYFLEAIFGTVSPTTVGASTKKRVYTPALADVITPKPFSRQWGDSNNVNQALYNVLSDLGLQWDRDTGVQYNGTKGFGRNKSTGETFTSTPTELANVPILGSHLKYYLDTTGANIGTTQVTQEMLDGSFGVTGVHAPFWASDRSQASYATTTNGDVPQHTYKLTLAESDLARTMWDAMIVGGTYFARADWQGQFTENAYTVALGAASAGTYSLTFDGQTASSIAFDADAATIQSDLEALSTIGSGNVTVTGASTPYTVTFTGTLAQTTKALTGDGTGLTGGTFAVTAAPQYYLLRIDTALQLQKAAAFSIKKTVYAREWDFTIVEDPTWAKALEITSQTLMASL